MATIGFIGLGNMGGPMAANLVKAGHEVRGYDLVEAALARFVLQGGIGVASPAEAAHGADTVITMLPAGPHVRELYLGHGELLHSVEAGTLLIDSSTIDSATAREVEAAARAAGCPMLDAPVSGGVAGASGGTLTFMVGGEAADLERARPLLEVMGRNIFHAGPAGAGQAAKMCNNMLLAITMIGTSEALNLGAAEGLDPAVLSEIMRQSSGGNWVLNGYNPYPGVMEQAPAARGYSGGFGVALMLKDLGLALDAANRRGNPVPMGAAARNLYALHASSGAGQKDFSSILQLLQGGAAATDQ